MAYILCIESATDVCSVAIGYNGELAAVETIPTGRRHSAMLTTLVQSCLDKTGIHLSKLSAVAISNGPGSYTGLRVGASVAKGICYGNNIPLIAVPTLKSLAWRHRNLSAVKLMPMIDARRMEVYTALYDLDLNEIRPVFNLILTEHELRKIVENTGPIVTCGNGAFKCREHFDFLNNLLCKPDQCDAALLTELAHERYILKDFVSTAYHAPFYFKKPHVTKGKSLFLS